MDRHSTAAQDLAPKCTARTRILIHGAPFDSFIPHSSYTIAPYFILLWSWCDFFHANSSIFYRHHLNLCCKPSLSFQAKMESESSSMLSFLSVRVFWKTYNSSDSMLPLFLPLIIWVSTYSYCRVQKQEFHRWYSLHNFHNFGAIGLGLMSLYFDDDAVFNERIPTLFSIGYFIVDVVDTG